VIARKLVARLAQEADISVAGHCAPDAACVSAHAKQRQPDLLLFYATSLGPDEIRSLRRIRRAAPRMRILLLIDQPRADTVEEILRNRFHGFLLADCPPEVCVRAIRAIARGEIWIPRTLLANALSEVLDLISRGALPGEGDLGEGDLDTPSVPNPCTSREQQVLELVRQGLTNKQIAWRLGITDDTVKKHLQHVYDKLGVRRRTLAVLRHGRAGLSALPNSN
jgi:DNA-binding NarL/FixJ family response regulator